MGSIRHGTTRPRYVGTFHFALKKTWARSVLADADKERQNGKDGGWQQGTPHKEELELVGCCKHYTAPRPLCHFALATFSREWLKIGSQTQCGANRVPSKYLFCHPRASCLTRTRHGLIFHLIHFHSASSFLPSRGGEHPPDPRTADGLVDWPHKVFSQGYEQRCRPCKGVSLYR